MKKLLAFVLLMIAHQIIIAQEIEKTKIYQELALLSFTRGQYEGYKNLFEKAPTNMVLKNKRDSLYEIYACKINLIKQTPFLYLKHIDCAIKNNKLNDKIRKIPYNYFPSITSSDPRPNMVTQLDLYKIIRYSLFEKNYDILPDLSTIPFYDKKKLVPFSQSN